MNGQVTFLPPLISGYKVETCLDFCMQELRVTQDKHKDVELCSPVGLRGTKSKIQSHLQEHGIGVTNK